MDIPAVLYEIGMLLLAFVLSLAIGVERSRRLKSAGLRTHVLVGIGSAMFTLISAYGFPGVSGVDAVVDPSRIAAQVVSGIGFLGAGVIFVKNNLVSGLTSAAAIWVVAAIGMACGAGMPALAIAGTLLHLLTVGPLSHLRDRVRPEPARVRVVLRYAPEQDVIRSVLTIAEGHGWVATLLGAARTSPEADLTATVEFGGIADTAGRFVLIEKLSVLPHVHSVVIAPSIDDE